MAAKTRKITTVEKKLIGVADVVIDAAQRRKDPTFAIPVRSLSNVTFDERKGLIELGRRKQARSFFNVGMAKKFMQTVLVADALCELQRANLTTSLREELHVRAENAGSIVGPLVLADDGDRVDCARLGKGGYSVPSIVEPEYLEIRQCTADFVLLVEKGTQWNRLSEDKFWRTYNCILLTGNGQPPRGVRRLARRLHEEKRLPVYVLVDNDPWGYYIYSVIKQGSINLAFESQRMAIPKAKFIGLSSGDPGAPGLHVVPEEELAGRDQADALEWPQVRAGCPRQQGLPVPHQEVSPPQAQREGLAGLARIIHEDGAASRTGGTRVSPARRAPSPTRGSHFRPAGRGHPGATR